MVWAAERTPVPPPNARAHRTLNEPPLLTVATAVVPLPPFGNLELLVLSVLALVGASFFAVLRVALLHSVPSRVLERARTDAERGRLRPRLERVESLATSASIARLTCQASCLVFVVALLGGKTLTWTGMVTSVLICVPLFVLTCELLPAVLRGEATDRLLRAVLVPFDLAQRPLGALIASLEAICRGIARLLRIPEKPQGARRIVEDLRDVVEESDREGDLRETEREIIENVVDLSHVDVAEIMTPRTELHAVELSAGVDEVVRAIASTGHSRLPVYDGSLDNIVGIAYAQEMLELLSRGELEGTELRTLLRPVGFVPETKLVAELLAQFRRDRMKLVIVLDEYGGTAGLVTLGDVLTELVGDMRQELGETGPAPIRRNPDGSITVDASTHVSDVNEALDLELPEREDYETLAGFVLAQLGRFPKVGETFTWSGLTLSVTEASDRRVLTVEVRLPSIVELDRGRAATGS